MAVATVDRQTGEDLALLEDAAAVEGWKVDAERMREGALHTAAVAVVAHEVREWRPRCHEKASHDEVRSVTDRWGRTPDADAQVEVAV
jgi:hypothetical protein